MKWQTKYWRFLFSGLCFLIAGFLTYKHDYAIIEWLLATFQLLTGTFLLLFRNQLKVVMLNSLITVMYLLAISCLFLSGYFMQVNNDVEAISLLLILGALLFFVAGMVMAIRKILLNPVRRVQ